MALLLPLLMVMLFGGFEAGHFAWTQHKLTEAVRNGARFASRLPVENFCTGSGGETSPVTIADIKRVTRTGQLAGSTVPAVPGWSDDEVTVEVACGAYVATGIYRNLGGPGPIVTVSAQGVAYPSLFGRLGVIDPELLMSARSSAAVTGL
jgi:Flp pilus assembly protein TadG